VSDEVATTRPRDGVLRIELHRPERLNAMTADMVEGLHAALTEAERDPTCRVVVLTGAGRGFCAGLDLDGYGVPPYGADDEGAVHRSLRVQRHIATLMQRIRRLPQPVIAQVNGPAAGGGLALVLASDLRIAATDAVFAVSFMRVGFSAYARGNHEAAAAAWSRAGASGHAEAAPLAAVNLGVLRKRLGDTDGAVAALEQASASRHPHAAPWASVSLGMLRKHLGDAVGAAAAFEQAEASGHPDAAPLARLNLRLLRNQPGNGQVAPGGATDVVRLIAQGDVAAARLACEQVIASGHPDEAPRAAVDLGALLAMQGDIDGARVAFEYAADSRHPDHAPWAVIGMGVLLTRLGDAAYARRAYQSVVESGHPQAALVAASNLEILGEDG